MDEEDGEPAAAAEEWLTVADALRAFVDAALWEVHAQAVRALESHDRTHGRAHPSWEPGVRGKTAVERTPARTQRVRAVEEAEREIVGSLVAQLRGRKLVAWGLPLPMTAETRRTEIHPDLWARLVPDAARSTAKGGGLAFAEVRIRRPGGATLSPALAAPAVDIEDEEPRLRGYTHAFEHRMKQLIRDGRTFPSKARLAAHLCDWVFAEGHWHKRPSQEHAEKWLRKHKLVGELVEKTEGD